MLQLRIFTVPKWRLKWLRSSRALRILPGSIALASIKSRLKIQGIHRHPIGPIPQRKCCPPNGKSPVKRLHPCTDSDKYST